MALLCPFCVAVPGAFNWFKHCSNYSVASRLIVASILGREYLLPWRPLLLLLSNTPIHPYVDCTLPYVVRLGKSTREASEKAKSAFLLTFCCCCPVYLFMCLSFSVVHWKQKKHFYTVMLFQTCMRVYFESIPLKQGSKLFVKMSVFGWTSAHIYCSSEISKEISFVMLTWKWTHFLPCVLKYVFLYIMRSTAFHGIYYHVIICISITLALFVHCIV